MHWYGIMYLLGFAAGWWLARTRAARPGSSWKPVDVDDFVFFAMVGGILGGRIGYVLFYGLKFWARGPLVPGQGVGRRHVDPRRHAGCDRSARDVRLAARPQLGDVFDFAAPLPGSACSSAASATSSMASYGASPRPCRGAFSVDGQVRHASQLYEAASKAWCCSCAVVVYRRSRGRAWRHRACSWCITAWSRILVEFVRVPDEHIGYLAGGWLTDGQVLSLPMILIGIALLAYAYRTRAPSGNYQPAR